MTLLILKIEGIAVEEVTEIVHEIELMIQYMVVVNNENEESK